MKLTLSDGEIRRAVQRYVETKSTPPAGHEWGVRIIWRGEPPRAEVELRKCIPTLNDEANQT